MKYKITVNTVRWEVELDCPGQVGPYPPLLADSGPSSSVSFSSCLTLHLTAALPGKQGCTEVRSPALLTEGQLNRKMVEVPHVSVTFSNQVTMLFSQHLFWRVWMDGSRGVEMV